MTTPDPFTVLGLPARPDLTDEQVRAAWRAIATATHPDREDGGDPARYAAASAACAALRTAWGRSEAYADLTAAAPARPLPGRPRPAPVAGRVPWSRPASATAGPCGWSCGSLAAAVVAFVVTRTGAATRRRRGRDHRHHVPGWCCRRGVTWPRRRAGNAVPAWWFCASCGRGRSSSCRPAGPSERRSQARVLRMAARPPLDRHRPPSSPGTYRRKPRPDRSRPAPETPATPPVKPRTDSATPPTCHIAAGHSHTEDRRNVMQPEPGNGREKGKEHAGNSPGNGPESAIYSYNMDDSKTPGGLKVRWKIRVVTGPEAARLDARQAEAIKELLPWARQHPAPQLTPRTGDAGAGRVRSAAPPPCAARPGRVDAPPGPRMRGQAARPAGHRRLVLGRRVRRPPHRSSAATARCTSSSPRSASPATAAWPTCSPKPPAPNPGSPP